MIKFLFKNVLLRCTNSENYRNMINKDQKNYVFLIIFE